MNRYDPLPPGQLIWVIVDDQRQTIRPQIEQMFVIEDQPDSVLCCASNKDRPPEAIDKFYVFRSLANAEAVCSFMQQFRKKWNEQMMISADETSMMFVQDLQKELEDRALFVKNLGWLLSQTREGVEGCSLSKDDIVTVAYHGGGKQFINVHLDSYIAIIRDVCKKI